MLKIVSVLIKSPIVETLCSRLNPSQFSNWRCLHLTHSQFKDPDKEEWRKLGNRHFTADGENVVDIDEQICKNDTFPDMHTPNKLFNGIPFKDIPIVNIRVSKNNTIVTFKDSRGIVKILKSCGTEGFKNAKKGSNIAGQATAIAVATRAIELGFKTIRVCIRGLGPGRMTSVKGLEMAGMDIISITDATRVTWNPLRPRKARRV